MGAQTSAQGLATALLFLSVAKEQRLAQEPALCPIGVCFRWEVGTSLPWWQGCSQSQAASLRVQEHQTAQSGHKPSAIKRKMLSTILIAITCFPAFLAQLSRWRVLPCLMELLQSISLLLGCVPLGSNLHLKDEHQQIDVVI